MTCFRYIRENPLESTLADCMAESLGLAIDSLHEYQEERWPCSCETGDEDHDEECLAYDRERDTCVLHNQLDELHKMASRTCSASKADPSIWLDGPDSEAARAARTGPTMWAELELLGQKVAALVVPPKADPELWEDEAARAAAEDRGALVQLDPTQGVGFSRVEPSCGELGLELDVEGVRGTVYISEEMWRGLGASMGWEHVPVRTLADLAGDPTAGVTALRQPAPEVHLATEQNRAVHGALVASVEPADFVGMDEPEPDHRAMWEEQQAGMQSLCDWLVGNLSPRDGMGDEPMVEVEPVVMSLRRLLKPAPKTNPTHAPAVRRVVAWEVGGRVCESREAAYQVAALARLGRSTRSSARFWRRVYAIRDVGDARWQYERAVRDRLASLLRHRDERAGCR